MATCEQFDVVVVPFRFADPAGSGLDSQHLNPREHRGHRRRQYSGPGGGGFRDR